MRKARQAWSTGSLAKAPRPAAVKDAPATGTGMLAGSEEQIQQLFASLDSAHKCRQARQDLGTFSTLLGDLMRRSRPSFPVKVQLGVTPGSPKSGKPLGEPAEPLKARDAKGWMRPPTVKAGTDMEHYKSYDKLMQYKEEVSLFGNMKGPTVRQVCRIDDSIDPRMQTCYQDPSAGALRVELRVPLLGDAICRTVAKERVLACLPKDLHGHVSVCVPLGRGTLIEVRLLELAALSQIADCLDTGLGTVSHVRERGLDRDTALHTMMFGLHFINPHRPRDPEPEEAALEAERARLAAEQAAAEEAQRQKKKLRRAKRVKIRARRKTPFLDRGAGVWQLGGADDDESDFDDDTSSEEDEEEGRYKLQSAIAKWDAKLAQCQGFREAAQHRMLHSRRP